MAFNTGNPVPSNKAEDLSDNAENLDSAVNSTGATWTDRLGVVRQTVIGATNSIDAASTQGLIDIAQDVGDVEASADAFDVLALDRVNKIGVIYDSPIRDWSESLLVDDLRAHRYPATTGDIYIPKKALPFTTGATFEPADWNLLQGVTDGDIINDLSQAYIFDTVAEYKASAIVFPVGKTVHLNDRRADFKVIAGTGTGNGGNVIANTSINQSVSLTDHGGLINMGCKLDGVTDDTLSFMLACSWSRENKKPLIEKEIGTLKYSSTADFTANSAGLIWGGVSTCKLLYSGANGTDAVAVDNGGMHPVALVESQTGVFLFGESVVGQTSGNHSVIRQRHSGAQLELQHTSDGGVIAEDIVGATSGATASLTAISSIDYGGSLQDIKLKGFTIRADRTQSFDGFSRPLDWAESTGLYLNSFRNGCEVKDVRPEGFRFGHFSKFNWLASISNCKPHTCWASHTLDGEFNSAIFSQNSASRSGDVTNTSGWGLLFTSSYGTDNKAFDMERGNGKGIIYENLRGCSHTVGDIESNGGNSWQIHVRGLVGSPLNSLRGEDYTQGFSINSARIYKDLGIEFNDGVYGCVVRSSQFSVGDDTPTSNSFIARVNADNLDTVNNILFENSNSYYGKNREWNPDIALRHRSTEWLDETRAEYFSVVSQSLDVTNGNGLPIGNLPNGAVLTQVDFFADNSNIPTSAGSFQVDLGLEGAIGAFFTNEVVTVPTGGTADVYSSPYGLYHSKKTGFNSAQGGGVLRARIDTDSVGIGSVFLRVWYKMVF